MNKDMIIRFQLLCVLALSLALIIMSILFTQVSTRNRQVCELAQDAKTLSNQRPEDDVQWSHAFSLSSACMVAREGR
jgi:hypothetical protein